mmetsp:Transcript_14728/g.34978  ORF Transcript_14728/g.34978 Transcript_14728/m.34978 type:complete len:211 (-) Transcript_14728:511-1143(-)
MHGSPSNQHSMSRGDMYGAMPISSGEPSMNQSFRRGVPQDRGVRISTTIPSAMHSSPPTKSLKDLNKLYSDNHNQKDAAEKASETAVRRMEKINQEAVKKEMMKKSQSASFGRTGSSGNKKSSGYDDPDLISRPSRTPFGRIPSSESAKMKGMDKSFKQKGSGQGFDDPDIISRPARTPSGRTQTLQKQGSGSSNNIRSPRSPRTKGGRG